MRLRRITTLALAALLAVGACSKSDTATQTAGSAAATPATKEEAKEAREAGQGQKPEEPGFAVEEADEEAAANQAAGGDHWSRDEDRVLEDVEPEPVDMPAAPAATIVSERAPAQQPQVGDSKDKGYRYKALKSSGEQDGQRADQLDDQTTRFEASMGPKGKKGEAQEGEEEVRGYDADNAEQLDWDGKPDGDTSGKDRNLSFAKEKKQEQEKIADNRRREVTIEPDVPEERPERFLPRMLYFENTYLGGDAAYLENLRRVTDAMGGEAAPHLLARAYPQPFDPPADAGLALYADLDTRWIERPGRVILQVGLRGSERFGWRRPPLEVVLVVDPAVLTQGTEPAVEVAGELLNQLGPQDRLAVVIAGDEPQTIAPLGHVRTQRGVLATALDHLERPRASSVALAQGMRRAGALLEAASIDRSTLPGTQTVLVLTSGAATDRVEQATAAAHELTVKGVVTSVIETNPADAGAFWAVANAGYGNYHRAVEGGVRDAVHDELDSLARVVARLVRVNIRLSKGAHAIRILGSRVLDEQEVARVKAREVAADRHISRTMGVAADRGDDDDGIQTVIPYFSGGDSHVILVELWVDEPGAVADVTLRYKDMVRLDNATARTTVSLRNVPRDETAEQRLVSLNARGLSIGATLEHAAIHVRRGDLGQAMASMRQARELAETTTPLDARAVRQLEQLVASGSWTGNPHEQSTLAAALTLAGRRKVGEPAQQSAAAAADL